MNNVTAVNKISPVANQLSLGILLALCGFLISASPVLAKEKVYPSAVVVEAFLEIHTGPGRSYPVFYIAEKGELISLLKRRTDWYKIKLIRGQEGWVHRDEVAKTVRASGYEKDWAERLFDDYIENQFKLGWAWGSFDHDTVIYIRSEYFFTEALSGELSLGFASGAFGGTDLYLAGLTVTPWRGQWFSLNGSLGGGFIQTDPANLLINAKSEDFPTAYAGIGFFAPLFRGLSLRGDFRRFMLLIDTERTSAVEEYSIGVMFNF